MVDERFIAAWTERLVQGVPGAVAVLLKGSHLRGNAGPFSDVDFDVLVDGTEIADPYLSWIEPDTSGRLVHVSVALLRERLGEVVADLPPDWPRFVAGGMLDRYLAQSA